LHRRKRPDHHTEQHQKDARKEKDLCPDAHKLTAVSIRPSYIQDFAAKSTWRGRLNATVCIPGRTRSVATELR
jgi:hypothetical protein